MRRMTENVAIAHDLQKRQIDKITAAKTKEIELKNQYRVAAYGLDKRREVEAAMAALAARRRRELSLRPRVFAAASDKSRLKFNLCF
jgi:hypothetical protein